VEAPRARGPLRRLALVGRGPDRSFEQLYRRHARDVYQYALAVLANPADAEDVTQTTFLNAYRAFQKGERPQKPHNWLIAIAHNVCRMRWRQAGSRPKEVALDEAPEPVALDQERPDLDEVLTALAQLSFNQRAALVMRELEGRSYQEISEVLGVSVSAVEALLFRARRRLQLKRSGLGVLTTVPLPGSLGGLFGGGGGAVAAGGAVFGANLVLKAAAVVALGTAVAGAGYRTVHVASASDVSARPQQAVSTVAPSRHAATRKATQAARARSVTHHGSRSRRASRPVPAGQRPTASTASAAVPAEQRTPASPTASTAASPPPAVVVQTPPLPVAPPVTVTVPALPPVLPLPPVPPVTVTVPPVLPPPPPLP
jgi:RNA polymerase sigma factor (sigma-70 family)